ncbi:MAG: hypothetical protein R3338_05280 [Thermoanaerobaculia bacterium]|nr:hypothetical protein [Thermoanaerobaculia bacterium]
MIRASVAVLLFGYATVGYSATTDCEGSSYERALCWYVAGELDLAEEGFAEVVGSGGQEPEVLRAIYFLSRTKMRQQEYEEASRLLIELFELSPAFFRDWSGDYLLGICMSRSERGAS